MEDELKTKYDDSNIDVNDSMENYDIKINPDFYIHSAILKAQTCLMKENQKEGFLQFVVLVQHLEVLAEAANRLGTDYKILIDDYCKSSEYLDQKDNLVKDVRLANKKIGLIMKEVFSNRTIIAPIKA